MLRRIRVEDLKEGMIFSEPLFFDDGKNRVLGKMHPVTQRELAVLKQWKVPFVLTAGKAVKHDSEISDLVEELDVLSDESDTTAGKQSGEMGDADILKLPDVLNHSELYSEYLSIVDAVDTFLNDIKQKKPIQPRPVDGIALRLHNLLAADRTLAISFILAAEIQDHDMAKALVDSAILAETIAVFMKEPADYR